MTERELTLFSAMTNIGDDLVLESTAFLPAVGGAVGSAVGGTATAASAGKRAAWVLPVTLASCAALVAAVGIAVGVVGNAFGFFPHRPPEVTTEEGTTEDATADLPAEGEEYLVSFVINGYPAAPPAPQRVKAGMCAVEPAVAPFDDGGRFDGWYTAEDRGADSRFDFSTPITADMALYGAWIPMTDTPTEELTDTPTEEPTEEVTEPETEPPVDDGVTLPETPDAGSAYQDKLIFVGDSLTAHLINRGVLTGGRDTKQVWRTESNVFNLNLLVNEVEIIYPETGEKMTVAQAAGVAKPEIMIITLGTDWGVTYLNESEFKACYASLIQTILAESPDTRIILQSIFPVTEDCVSLGNDKIDTANGWVKDIAAENGCRYLDTQSVLKDEEGCLKAEYCSSADGIHLNKEAYEVILAYIRTHALTAEDDTQDAQPMPETVRDALTTHTDILHSTMVSWQRNLENVTVERVMDAIDRIEAASEFFGATNEGGYYLEVRDGNVYLCRKIVYPIHDGAEEGSQILSELLGEKS
ncbi:MAG: InlB B-repeat-containing protein [Clostridia bacterium]|nr:InlB B-repeat-containing protein [Clostridia bacterium]